MCPSCSVLNTFFFLKRSTISLLIEVCSVFQLSKTYCKPHSFTDVTFTHLVSLVVLLLIYIFKRLEFLRIHMHMTCYRGSTILVPENSLLLELGGWVAYQVSYLKVQMEAAQKKLITLFYPSTKMSRQWSTILIPTYQVQNSFTSTLLECLKTSSPMLVLMVYALLLSNLIYLILH